MRSEAESLDSNSGFAFRAAKPGATALQACPLARPLGDTEGQSTDTQCQRDAGSQTTKWPKQAGSREAAGQCQGGGHRVAVRGLGDLCEWSTGHAACPWERPLPSGQALRWPEQRGSGQRTTQRQGTRLCLHEQSKPPLPDTSPVTREHAASSAANSEPDRLCQLRGLRDCSQ